MKTFILSFLKHIKSFNNFLLNLSIKSIASFNLIKIIIKYYSYFKYILEYYKEFRFYKLFKIFFKLLALINILLGLFSLIIFTDFRYDDYKIFIGSYLNNFYINDLFLKFKNYLKTIYRYIVNLFIDSFGELEPSYERGENPPKDSSNLDKNNIVDKNNIKNNIKNDSYLPYYLFGLFTFIVCIKYPQYTIYPIGSFITGVVSSLFGGNGGPDPDTNDDDSTPTPTPSNSKGKKRVIDTADVDHLRTFPSDPSSSVPTSSSSPYVPSSSSSSSVPSSSSSSSDSSSSKSPSNSSFLDTYFPIRNTVSNMGGYINDLIDGNPFSGVSDWDSDDSTSTIVPTTTVVTVTHDPLDRTPGTTVIYDVDAFPGFGDVPTSSNTTPSTSAIITEGEFDSLEYTRARSRGPKITMSEVPTSSIPDNLDDVTTPISTTPDPSKGGGLRGKFQVSPKKGIWK